MLKNKTNAQSENWSRGLTIYTRRAVEHITLIRKEAYPHTMVRGDLKCIGSLLGVSTVAVKGSNL